MPLRVKFINDWTKLAKNFFYFGYFCFELSIGKVALFYLGAEPGSRPGECYINIALLGFGIQLRVGLG